MSIGPILPATRTVQGDSPLTTTHRSPSFKPLPTKDAPLTAGLVQQGDRDASRMRGALSVMELKDVPDHLQGRVIQKLADAFCKTWGNEDDGFRTRQIAEKSVRERLGKSKETDPKETIFVALGPRGGLRGTGSIGTDYDYYREFSEENKLTPEQTRHIGRDLYVVPRYRGTDVDGARIWKHLVEARLNFVKSHGGERLTVFAEKGGDKDLIELYRRNGAVLDRDGLSHKDIGPDSIAMLHYPLPSKRG